MPIPQVRIVKDDIVVVKDAFIVSFYMNETHAALLPRVRQVLATYLKLVGLRALPYRLDADGEIDDVDTTRLDAYLGGVFQGSQDDLQVIRLVGAVDDETGYRFTYIADDLQDPACPDLRNLVSLWLPTERCVELGWNAVYAFACDVARTLEHYSYGYGSPCLAYIDIRDAIPIARRHQGFDIALGRACRVDIDDKVLGVYWLELLGEVASRALGGPQALATALLPPTTVEGLGGDRVAIRLGSEPAVADVNRQVDLPAYRQLGDILADYIHIPASVYFADADGTADPDAMAAWHKRFTPPHKLTNADD